MTDQQPNQSGEEPVEQPGRRAAACDHPPGELVPIRRLGVDTGRARCAACGQILTPGADAPLTGL